MPRVFIASGHGYNSTTGAGDPGAVGNGLKEADINLNISLEMQRELVRHGVVVGMSQMVQEIDPSADEIREANAFKPDLCVSVHTNAGGGDGFEVYHQTNSYTEKSIALAEALKTEVKAMGQNIRGLKIKLLNGLDYFGVLRQINAPTVLAECAFIDNKTDVQIIDTLAEQQAFGRAYAKAVLNILGITYKPVQSVPGVRYGVARQVIAYDDKSKADKYASELNAKGEKDAYYKVIEIK